VDEKGVSGADKGFDFSEGEAGGQGGAFRLVGLTKIAFFSVVNSPGMPC
jgi:hypothetical protein